MAIAYYSRGSESFSDHRKARKPAMLACILRSFEVPYDYSAMF